MIVYRLTSGKYAHDLSGEGAKLFGGRWNPAGIAALYTSEFISLSILEILARAKQSTIPETYTLLSIQIPDTSIVAIELQKLTPGWQHHFEYTRWVGEEFLKINKTLILKIPSAIVPQEHNFMINPLHQNFKKVKILDSELLALDKRLLQTAE